MKDAAKAVVRSKRLQKVGRSRWSNRAYTQREIAEMLNVEIHRQPRDEILVFDAMEYVGVRYIQRTYAFGVYRAHIWRGRLSVMCRFTYDEPRAASLEIRVKNMRLAKDKGIIDVEPKKWVGLYTIVADERGEIVSFLEGDHLDEYSEEVDRY